MYYFNSSRKSLLQILVVFKFCVLTDGLLSLKSILDNDEALCATWDEAVEIQKRKVGVLIWSNLTIFWAYAWKAYFEAHR